MTEMTRYGKEEEATEQKEKEEEEERKGKGKEQTGSLTRWRYF